VGTIALMGAGKGAPGAAPSNPGGIGTAPVWWVKADAGTYQDAARTTPATADGDPVGGWVDQSTSAKHLAQSTSSKRPVLKLNIQNSLPAIRFDGVDDFMDAASAVLSSAAAWTAFIVHKTTGDIIWAGGIGGSTNNQLRIGQGGTYTLSMYDGSNNPISLTAAPARTVWTQAAYQNGPHYWVNGTSRDNAGTIGNMSQQRFFADVNGTAALVNGDVGEILIYNTALSSGDRAAVESYLQARWAL
jgi:hypothetical protein